MLQFCKILLYALLCGFVTHLPLFRAFPDHLIAHLSLPEYTQLSLYIRELRRNQPIILDKEIFPEEMV